MASATHEPTAKGPQGSGPEGSVHDHRALPSGRQILERLISLREGSIIVVTIVVAIYFSANTSTFFTGNNFKTLLPYFAPLAILGAGEVFVMILGEIDLSIGGMYMFAPIVYYKLDSAGLGLVASLIIALLICSAVGLVNGAFVAFLGVSSFVTTLGMLFGFEGLGLILSHGTPVATPGGQVHSTTVNVQHVVNGHTITLPEKVNHIGTFAKIFGGGVYSELIWAVVIVVVLQVVLTFTRWGLYTVAIGSNKIGAAEAGVKVKLVTVRNFMTAATLAGLVGVFEAIRSQTIQPDPAGPNEILLIAIAGAVIGGTLLSGGSGTVIGAFIGALFLGILKDGLILQGVNANYLLFYTGIAIVVAMTANVYVGRVRRGHGGSG
ncbi:MAG TPA: ABC transporter permease [Solirubrobacteraceae bacterium]|nr:ABC transporter permease [Solirubrobacteraceae bacterium]